MAQIEARIAEIDHDLARIQDRINEIDINNEVDGDELRRAFTRRRYLLADRLEAQLQLIELRHEVPVARREA